MDTVTRYFERFAETLPLEIFVLVGTFAEELFSPLPSFIVLLPAGAAAEVQGLPVWYLGVLALFSGIGRIGGAAILYYLADRFEDVVLRNRRMFGVTHTQLEQFGKRLERSSVRNWFILFAMNAIPIFPTPVLSLACGFVKVPYRLFLTATFGGTLINAVAYLVVGYYGFRTTDILQRVDFATQLVTVLLVTAAAAWLLVRSIRRRRARRPAR